MKPEKLIKKGRITALVSFLIGTLLLIIYYFTISDYIAIAGMIYVILALIINLLIVAFLLFSFIQIDKTQKAGILKTIGLMSLNIPIALICFYVVVLNVFKIIVTFENKTGENLTEFIVLRPDYMNIGELKINSSKTVRMRNPRIRDIVVEYNLAGEKHEVQFLYFFGTSENRVKYQVGIDGVPIQGKKEKLFSK